MPTENAANPRQAHAVRGDILAAYLSVISLQELSIRHLEIWWLHRRRLHEVNLDRYHLHHTQDVYEDAGANQRNPSLCLIRDDAKTIHTRDADSASNGLVRRSVVLVVFLPEDVTQRNRQQSRKGQVGRRETMLK